MIEYIIPKYNGSKWVYNIRTAENLKKVAILRLVKITKKLFKSCAKCLLKKPLRFDIIQSPKGTKKHFWRLYYEIQNYY